MTYHRLQKRSGDEINYVPFALPADLDAQAARIAALFFNHRSLVTAR